MMGIGWVFTVLRAPFVHPLAAPAWLLVRLYLGWVWLRFGIGKLNGGWLTENPMEGMLGAIAAGHTAMPFGAYRHIAELLLWLGMDRWISIGLPLAEVAVAVAFLAGVYLVPVAAAACLLNLNLILSGIASWSFDGRIIVLQLLVLLAWRVAGGWGVRPLLAWLARVRLYQPVSGLQG